jgi:small subunit ribosomal protein S20
VIQKLTKVVEHAITGKDAAAATQALREAEAALARGANRGTLHWKTAARKTSRLAKRVKALGAAKPRKS